MFCPNHGSPHTNVAPYPFAYRLIELPLDTANDSIEIPIAMQFGLRSPSQTPRCICFAVELVINRLITAGGLVSSADEAAKSIATGLKAKSSVILVTPHDEVYVTTDMCAEESYAM